MSQPVKLSDALVLDARLAGETVERSIAGQVEFWAKIGKAIEPLLQGTQVLALCRNAATRPLSDCLKSVDSPAGRHRVEMRYSPAEFEASALVSLAAALLLFFAARRMKPSLPES